MQDIRVHGSVAEWRVLDLRSIGSNPGRCRQCRV